jgi:aldehyde:ferredoxin oxidoreductase
MHAKALVVDLTTRTSREQEFPRRYLEEYLGGRGLGARLLHDYVDPKTDPLGPDNCLIFVNGPLHASSAFYSSKSVLYTKSPQTGITLYTLASGLFCHDLARAGYDALIIKGKAEHPTWLSIKDSKVVFQDASKLWGLNTMDAEHLIRKKIPEQASLALIGPAGENLVKYACIVTEGRRHHAFGRGGGGAVMGSKNLKAIALQGTGTVPIADFKAFKQAQHAVSQKLAANPEWRTTQRRYGTRGGLPALNAAGILPTRQWQSAQYKDIAAFDSERLREDYFIEGETCGLYCPNPCYHWTMVREGEYKGALACGPEYETIYAFGSNLENSRFDSIIAADDQCDLLGMDTMSAGLTIGWAAECVERGLLTEKDTGGIRLEFGNHAMIGELLRRIAYREGIGDLLAEGSQLAAAKVGQGSDAWAMTAKGMEFGGYECRASWGQALQYALSHRGGCHHDLGLPARAQMGSPQSTRVEGQGEMLKNLAFNRIVYDSAVMCTFPLAVLGLEAASALLSAVIGRSLDVPHLREIGERVLNVERLWISKAGFGRAQDRLPDRLLKEPLPNGPGKGNVVPLEALKDDFYRAAGWDPRTAAPQVQTLERLGIELRA